MRMDRLLSSPRFFLSDGGLETFMVFDKGHDLPCFSAARLLETEAGRNDLTAYYERFIAIARASRRGFLIDAPTWRAGQAWASALGKSPSEQIATNAEAVAFVRAIRDAHETDTLPILINGLIGPAGDAYAPDTLLSADEAFRIHSPQIHALGQAGVDLVSAMTLTHASEAIGIARSAQEIDLPVVISFTLETDGRLPSGQPLDAAIAEVDAATDAAPSYYMINCAHPDHFAGILRPGADWMARIGGFRSNASRMSHAELDAADRLDDGDPVELGHLSRDLAALFPNVHVIGGCCGTDHRHVARIASHDHAPALT